MPRLLIAAALLAAAGCDDEVYQPCGALTADWHGVQCTLKTHCISCHGEPHSGSLFIRTVLPADVVRDLEAGTGVLVVPGDPDASLLWRSLAGTTDPADGQFWGTMPLGYSEPLPASQIDHVREWIAAGAPLDGRDLGADDTDTDGGT